MRMRGNAVHEPPSVNGLVSLTDTVNRCLPKTYASQTGPPNANVSTGSSCSELPLGQPLPITMTALVPVQYGFQSSTPLVGL